ncbi:phosphotransacetylase family protein [Prochlorococcus marinus]|uniref:BioD-like N-terminal domain of phosphotransacetylase n=1 Tax=Prochlorococcus marinus (strain MIT 9211) TaxID=93059 RepID=A9BEA0_PROM4|nr:phosphotransacetylase family protein [Prochlorococcus marinus]ABX08410.1 BioD-like N-terminal domain of phosphotransacetylase [Prochlorococcus marinus str. MIT 9211]
MGKTLMIGSCEPFSGKSALVLGIGRYLKNLGKSVRFGKPLATSFEHEVTNESKLIPLVDDDVRFVGSFLDLSEDQLIPSLHLLSAETADKRLAASRLESAQEFEVIKKTLNSNFEGLNILEAAGSLHEGLLYGLSLVQVAKNLNAKVLLVHLWEDSRSVEPLLAAKAQLGENLAGVVLNAVTPDDLNTLKGEVVPALEALGFDVFGVMPRSPLLRSVTVEELVRRLKARVICCEDKIELMVENLSIGAMNVNSAMEFFRKRRNMAVVTGADRTDIQLAALEASTQCLILTGAGEPLPQLINRSEELDVPLLKVDTDTLSTVEVIEQAFGHVRLHETVKAKYAFRLVQEHCDLDRLLETLGISF